MCNTAGQLVWHLIEANFEALHLPLFLCFGATHGYYQDLLLALFSGVSSEGAQGNMSCQGLSHSLTSAREELKVYYLMLLRDQIILSEWY